jgi:hypothetical protein
LDWGGNLLRRHYRDQDLLQYTTDLCRRHGRIDLEDIIVIVRGIWHSGARTTSASLGHSVGSITHRRIICRQSKRGSWVDVKWRLENILSACADVIAATLLLFATPDVDFRVDRRGAIVVAIDGFECGVKRMINCAAMKRMTWEKESERSDNQRVQRLSQSEVRDALSRCWRVKGGDAPGLRVPSDGRVGWIAYLSPPVANLENFADSMHKSAAVSPKRAVMALVACRLLQMPRQVGQIREMLPNEGASGYLFLD